MAALRKGITIKNIPYLNHAPILRNSLLTLLIFRQSEVFPSIESLSDDFVIQLLPKSLWDCARLQTALMIFHKILKVYFHSENAITAEIPTML